VRGREPIVAADIKPQEKPQEGRGWQSGGKKIRFFWVFALLN
jgi:hypothetical protein